MDNEPYVSGTGMVLTDVCGCFAGSFLGNFEWAQGYTNQSGPVYVDFKNGHTTHPKPIIVFLIWRAVPRRVAREDYGSRGLL